MTAPKYSLTLGVHLTARGFGWIAFEAPFAPYDWGAMGAHGDKNAVCMRKLQTLLERLTPEMLVVEACSPHRSARSMRIERLCTALTTFAADRGIQVFIYTRADVRRCFAAVGARTRHEIAEAVARHVDALRHRLPRKRRAWDTEDRRAAIFAAASIVLTHYQLGGSTISDALAS